MYRVWNEAPDLKSSIIFLPSPFKKPVSIEGCNPAAPSGSQTYAVLLPMSQACRKQAPSSRVMQLRRREVSIVMSLSFLVCADCTVLGMSARGIAHHCLDQEIEACSVAPTCIQLAYISHSVVPLCGQRLLSGRHLYRPPRRVRMCPESSKMLLHV